MDIPDHEETGEVEGQQWACGPMGWWPLVAFVPAGVSWSYTGQP